MRGSLKKLMISMLLCAFMLSSFVTITFAWISLSRNAFIDDLFLGTNNDPNLEISLDGINFTQNITSNELLQFTQDVEMIDITSIDGKTFKNIAGNVIEHTGTMISIPIYVRSRHRSNNMVFLANNNSDATFDNLGEGTAVTSRGVNWRADIGFWNSSDRWVNPGDLLRVYASNAVRISLVEQNINGFYGAIDIRTEDELSRRIVDPSEDAARGFGVMYGAIDFWYRRHGFAITAPPAPDTRFITRFMEFNQNVALDDGSLATTLTPTRQFFGDNEFDYWRVGKFIINIWLEGWDADTFDAIYSDQLRIRLQFRLGRLGN